MQKMNEIKMKNTQLNAELKRQKKEMEIKAKQLQVMFYN